MDIVAMDIAAETVNACRWDGAALRATSASFDEAMLGWSGVVARLGVSGPHWLIYRGDVSPDRIDSLARSNGAVHVRRITDDAPLAPEYCATRFAADKLRLRAICCAERREGRWRATILDERGGVVEGGLARARGEGLPIICDGRFEKEDIAALARDAASGVYVSNWAGSMGMVGLLLADIGLRVRREMRGERLSVRRMRQLFGEMMDEAYCRITAAGADLDDAECERFACVGRADGVGDVLMTCESMSDDAELTARAMKLTGSDRPELVELRALELRVVIRTPKPDLPITLHRFQG